MRALIGKTLWASSGWPTMLTLLLAAAGGAVLAYVGFPAGWLCGAMLSVAATALMGQRTHMPNLLRDTTFVVLGTSMGSTLTPQTLKDIHAWPFSIALLLCSVLASMVVGTFYLSRLYRWDMATARLSSVPGALSAVIALANGTTANLPIVALSQTLRQLVLVSTIPAVLMFGRHGVVSLPVRLASLQDAVSMLLAGAAGAFLLTKLRAPGAKLVGAMLASAALHGAGWVSGRLPPTVLTLAFICTGAVIGSRFAGTKLPLLLATIKPALGSIAAAIGISALFAGVCVLLLHLPFAQVWLAFAPGGVEAMTIMAFALNIDPSFVSTHHVIRLLVLMLSSPLWTFGLMRRT